MDSVQKRLPFEMLGVLAVTGWLFCAPGCSRKDPTGLEPSNSAGSAQKPAKVAESSFAASLPQVGGPAGYAGSKACRSCHKDQFESWHRSYHRTMTQITAADTVKADFHGVVLTNDEVRFVLSQRGDEFWVRMERRSPAETSPETLEVRIGLVTGSHHKIG